MRPHRSHATTDILLTALSCAVVLLLTAGTAAAEDKPAPAATVMPVPPPVPPPRPDDLPAPPAPPAPQNPVGISPLPPERPAELTPPAVPEPPKDAAAEMPTPPPRPPELSGTTALTLTVAPPDDSACRARLERLGAAFEPVPAITNGQCGAARPLKVSQLAGGVALTPPATLVCGAAEALARWTSEVQVAAERELGQPLKSLSIGTSYECRGQNHDPDAKLSEHSFANGVDVMGFGFAGRPQVLVGKGMENATDVTFQAAVRAKACGFFRTVLGPGSDAAHANHLHLDERERTAGHRLCQ